MSDDLEDLIGRYERLASDDDRPNPTVIAERVMQMPEHQHLVENGIRIEFLLRKGYIQKGNKRVLAAVHEPSVQGRLKDLFEMLLVGFLGHIPDFLVVIDAEYWLEEATDLDREALLFHELMHIQQKVDKYGDLRFNMEGNPVYGLAEHDVSAFHAEVRRYGAWSPDIQEFLKAAQS